MKKLLIAILTTASALMAADPLITELNALSIIKDSKINILKVQDEGDVYLVNGEPSLVAIGQQKKPFDFFITKDKKIIIMGNALYTDSKMKVVFPLDKTILEGKEAFSYGTGGNVMYVFLDPQCPYCKQFEKVMPTLKNKYTFKIYLFPLSFHADAIPMSKWILKGKDKNDMAERLFALANGSDEYKTLVLSADEEKHLTELINAQIEIAKDAEIRGTPTVLDSELSKVNWPSL
ncbi:thioredoxin fold domain-containing protein [Sulfuricurvum sp.]|uniref:thioredoxin fold domain-containing protein n=1 Tax=Sulfuricurvum sp. TaxID=2025608 RepID=UPI003BAF06FD